jgi:hypothetical protein
VRTGLYCASDRACQYSHGHVRIESRSHTFTSTHEFDRDPAQDEVIQSTIVLLFETGLPFRRQLIFQPLPFHADFRR